MHSSARLLVLVPLGIGFSGSPAEAAHIRHHPWGYHPRVVAETDPVPASPAVAGTAVPQAPETAPLPVTDNAGRSIAHQALAYRGARYKFGGTSKKGMDCSGLVSRIYDDLKLHRVPRVSAALFKSGRAVKAEELRPGDLVFFKNTYKRGISHVGVYAGNNKFVHAANKKHGVIVTSMADPYYQIHFAGARRLY